MLSEDSPLEFSVNNEAFFLADLEPMGVVAEVIRNDMGDSLGIVVYDDTTKQVHKFRASQLVVRPDGNVTVLPSWFRKSREILRSIGPMEQAIPVIRKAKRKGVKLTDEQAAQATSEAPAEVQRFIDEAVILRSQIIGKLHGLFEKQKTTQTQLRDVTNPGLFDRTPEGDRFLILATLKRSRRLNEQTIHAMRDFLISMDASYLFPKDPRYRSLFKVQEFQAVEEATHAPDGDEFETFEEEVAEFETFEEEVAEFDSFDEVNEFAAVEEFDTVDGFSPVPETIWTQYGAPPAHPLPPPPAAAAIPLYDQVEALPDDDDMTVHQQPSLMTAGAPGWAPQQPAQAMAPPPPPAPSAMGMSPPGAAQVPPPVPMQQMDALEASAQRKIEGEPAAPEPVAKKAGLMSRLRRGKEKQERPPAGAVAAGAVVGGAVVGGAGVASSSKDLDEFTPIEELTPLQAATPPPAHPIPQAAAMPPPPSIPPPPSYTPHMDTFQSVDEFETFSEPATAPQLAPVQATPVAPPPQAPAYAPQPAPAPAYVPAPVPVAAPVAVAEFETFEEEEVAEFGEVEDDRPLDAEKDIDSILAMALGKAPAPGTRPTAKPGQREELGSPMKSLMSKTKYRRS